MRENETKSNFMFDFISGIYSLFFSYQKKKFVSAIAAAKPDFDITEFKSALDVGCGTGALCSVLFEKGLQMTGLDNSKKMLETARRKNEGSDITFLYSDAVSGFEFKDDSFDLAFASYVAHGMNHESRQKLLYEMKRVASRYVILHEYGKKRKLATDLIESLEGGNYFGFIKGIEDELSEIFDSYKVIPVGENANWYICSV